MDGGYSITSGYWSVNRWGYYITAEPWPADTVIQVLGGQKRTPTIEY
jgi:hypothetical protein